MQAGFYKVFILFALYVTLSACASTRTQTGEINDPLENINRPIFAFNTAIDKAVISPASEVYDTMVPPPAKKGIRNFLQNLREPWTFVNDILQLKLNRAAKTLARFTMNTTVGIGGLWNPATRVGLPRHTEDLGQTLAHWGIGDGAYVVLPFFGPSTLRDTVGFGLEFFYEPVTLYADKKNKELWNYGRAIMYNFDLRVQFRGTIDALYEEKDPYVYARSAYMQARAFAIRDGKRIENTEEEDMFDEFEEDDMFDDSNVQDQFK